MELPLDNRHVAERLEEVADLLEGQSANPFRVRAYRTAARLLHELDRQVHAILRAEGIDGLVRLPGIGHSLARSMEQLVPTGRLGLLERLRGEGSPEQLFATVLGIGREMAARIHEQLDIETLTELEMAAYDSRLSTVPGMGRKRIRAVRESLAGRFRRGPPVFQPARRAAPADQPSVAELLDIDRQYRRQAEAGRLPRIAPRRFNPTGEAWLPILHTERGERHYTVLYSNTARAHELGTIREWVIIYRDDQDGDGRWTVITSRFGKLRGRRAVRGREAQCAQYYAELGESEKGQSELPFE